MTTLISRLRRRPALDRLSFFLLWLRGPKRVGAVAPSSESLAAAMAGEIDPDLPGVVVELGGGTGSITAGLLEAGIGADDLIVVEREPSLCRVVAGRFPHVRVICGDARHLSELLREAGVERVRAVVSSLPLMAMSERDRRTVVAEAMAVLPPDGVLVQFTYGPTSPVSRTIRASLGIVGDRAHWVLQNLPPAAVWRYRRVGTGTRAGAEVCDAA